MKDDGDGSIQTGRYAIGYTGIAGDTGHQPMQLIGPKVIAVPLSAYPVQGTL